MNPNMLKLSSDTAYCVQLLDVFAHARCLVRQYFEPPQDGVQECALPFEYTRHERAQGLRADQNQGEVNGNL
jgi:hypothetical protein